MGAAHGVAARVFVGDAKEWRARNPHRTAKAFDALIAKGLS